MNHLIPCVSLSLLLTGPLAIAQQVQDLRGEPTPRPAAPLVSIHRPSFDGVPDDRLWAAADGYKASFGQDVTFIPYLGQQYPCNQPFTWATQAITVGGEPLAMADSATARHTAHRYELDWGSAVEAYDVRADGLEQTFVFGRRPGSGDLVIRGAVKTALRPTTAGERHGPLTFVDVDGREILGYGAAVAIDAAGTRFPMTTAWQDGAILLRLSAADLAAAAFPLVVDPLLSRAGIPMGLSPGFEGDFDMHYGPATSTYRVAMTRARYASAQDGDVYLDLASTSYTVNFDEVFADLSTAWSASHPRLAMVAATNKIVMVYETYVPASDLSRLRVHLHQAGTIGSTTNSIGLLNATGEHDRRPDVGGTAVGVTGNHALIVFQRETTGGGFGESSTSQVMGLLFDTSTTSGAWGARFQIGASGNIDNERPRVNKATEGGSWICVFQRFDNAIVADDWDVIGKRIGTNGTVATGQWISSTQSRHQMGPVVDGQNGRYAVVFATEQTVYGKLTGIVGRDIRVERFDWGNGAAEPTAATDQPSVTLLTTAGRTLEAGGIAIDPLTRSHWTVGFRDTNSYSYGARLGYHGRPTEGPTTLYGLSPGASTVRAYHDTVRNVGVLAYSLESVSPQFGTWWTRYDHSFAYPAPAAITTAGTGCTAQVLAWGVAGAPSIPPSLSQQIGNEFTQLSVTGQGSAVNLHIAVASLATADAPVPVPEVPAGCRLLVSTGAGYLGALPLAIGANPSWQIPLPESLGAGTLHFQDWVLNTSTNLIRSTSRLTVPLVR